MKSSTVLLSWGEEKQVYEDTRSSLKCPSPGLQTLGPSCPSQHLRPQWLSRQEQTCHFSRFSKVSPASPVTELFYKWQCRRQREDGCKRHLLPLLADVTSSLRLTCLALVWRGGMGCGSSQIRTLPTWVLPWQLLSLSWREVGRQEGSVCSLLCITGFPHLPVPLLLMRASRQSHAERISQEKQRAQSQESFQPRHFISTGGKVRRFFFF